jgi:hypothetical protein
MYGKLSFNKRWLRSLIRYYLTDLQGNEEEMLPDLDNWLSKKEGHRLNVFVSDKRYFITDEEAI